MLLLVGLGLAREWFRQALSFWPYTELRNWPNNCVHFETMYQAKYYNLYRFCICYACIILTLKELTSVGAWDGPAWATLPNCKQNHPGGLLVLRLPAPHASIRHTTLEHWLENKSKPCFQTATTPARTDVLTDRRIMIWPLIPRPRLSQPTNDFSAGLVYLFRFKHQRAC